MDKGKKKLEYRRGNYCRHNQNGQEEEERTAGNDVQGC